MKRSMRPPGNRSIEYLSIGCGIRTPVLANRSPLGLKSYQAAKPPESARALHAPPTCLLQIKVRAMPGVPHQIGTLVRNLQFAPRSSLRCNKCSRLCGCIFLRFVEMSRRIAMIPTRAAIISEIGTENHHNSRTVSNNRPRLRASNDEEQTKSICLTQHS